MKQVTEPWQDDLRTKGFAVIKGAIPRERAIAYQQKAFDWLDSFGNAFDINNPETWLKANLPVQTKINTFHHYAVMHEKFMWDARMEPRILDVFSKVWGTDKLLVSFDALNITFPHRKDAMKNKPGWQHVDQSPLRDGMQCVQGIINLSEAGPEDGGLLVFPGSHLLTEEFFRTQTDKSTWSKMDLYLFSKEQMKWFEERGIHAHKVCAEPGDLLIWDSRTIHYAVEQTDKSNTIRTVIYATYTPASFATEEVLDLKAEIFKNWQGTSHWPHDNIVARGLEAIREDGNRDPKDRSEPLEKPEITDKLLKLAGVLRY